MNFIASPNLPNICVSEVLVDYRTSEASVSALRKMGIEVIFSCEVKTLYNAVKGHSDMMLHHMGENKFIAAPEAYDYLKKVLPDAEIIKGSKALGSKYPEDIAYNAAVLKDYVICNTACTASEILAEYKHKGKTILNVNQGYAKCSICVVSDNAIITADNGIYKTAAEHGIDVLKIREGYIKLKGMPYGFFGGASGLISKNKLAVNGNIETHPDCDKIRGFCKKYGVEVISLNLGEIEDIGSIIPLF